MMMLTLDISDRGGAKPASLRARSLVPAVFYGPKESTTPFVVDARKLAATWKEAGETTIITLQGLGEPKETLIKDVQIDPVKGTILHADFYVLEKGKKIEISVPLEFVGQARAEKQGHVLVKALHEIEIEVAPAELPHSLNVDVSKLENVGDHVTAAEVKLPPSASLITDPEEIVASVTEAKEEVVEEAPLAPEGEAPAAGAPTAEGEAPAQAE